MVIGYTSFLCCFFRESFYWEADYLSFQPEGCTVGYSDLYTGILHLWWVVSNRLIYFIRFYNWTCATMVLNKLSEIVRLQFTVSGSLKPLKTCVIRLSSPTKSCHEISIFKLGVLYSKHVWQFSIDILLCKVILLCVLFEAPGQRLVIV